MGEPTKFTAYITKYALTAGIQEIVVEDCFDVSPEMVRDALRYNANYHGNDWHRARKDAVLRANNMRTDKIKSLKKQMDRLAAMKFEEDV